MPSKYTRTRPATSGLCVFLFFAKTGVKKVDGSPTNCIMDSIHPAVDRFIPWDVKISGNHAMLL
ncbi:hypothetical protein BsIDN1_71610 [Bacillus safensis]|uniref:Uncharacterized protein n=1 Tax=Bacillus safensis TaxID=561879 RepID=A0A5S9MKC1_BACIA|nr:hypothetical protein BsIDN1_71610 [Bacillus safensis]